MNLNHNRRRYQQIHVRYFIYRVELRIIDDHMVDVSFEIIETEATLIIRIHAANR